MQPIMVLYAFAVRKALAALRTAVRFFSAMRSFMSVQIARVAELFWALGA